MNSIELHKANALEAGHGDELWWYLGTPAYQVRYALTGAFIKAARCRSVLELGGFKTPISRFLHGGEFVESAVSIDPFVRPFHRNSFNGHREGQVLHLRTIGSQFPLRGDEDAIVFLGFPKEIGPDVVLMPNSLKLLVIGGANYYPIQNVLDEVEERATEEGFTKVLDFIFDMSPALKWNPDISPDPDNHNRRIRVLTRYHPILIICIRS